MVKKLFNKNLLTIISLIFIIFFVFLIFPSEKADAGSYDGEDLALAILENSSTLVSSSYTDTDRDGCRQKIILSSLGTMTPTDGSTFVVLGTGIAGAVPATTNILNPGDERGTWFKNRYGHPRDKATLTLTLQVPPYMHYLYYDIQFFSTEYPEYVGTQFNDKITVTVNSPSQGTTTYIIDVNSGDFVLNANDIPGTGFDIFAQSGNPGDVDWVDTTPRIPGADAGATALVTREHPVSPNEQITVIFSIKDTGDNQFDSAAFIDNLMFSGYAKTDIIARKNMQDLNGEPLERNDTMEYTVTISNIGNADQGDSPGNEFEDILPDNATYVTDSATATSGTIAYITGENKITWNGAILQESSIVLKFRVTVNPDVENGTIISNQGEVYWDSNEDGTNDATELTDDPHIDDGIDQDGDGDTDDDDPTNISVTAFEAPSNVTEDFSDDDTGGSATQSYLGRAWFSTSNGKVGNIFEVVSGYYYSTAKSFKTKLRSSGSPQYWNYSLSELDSNIKYWEVWFKCGNASEDSNLQLAFKNSAGTDIAKIKFEYVQMGTEEPMDWVLELYYYSPTGWVKLFSDYSGGYLYNDWYKIRVEKNNNPSYINYSLYRRNNGLVDFRTDNNLGASFSNLARVEWTNTKNPIVCPMFFWDEHILGLE